MANVEEEFFRKAGGRVYGATTSSRSTYIKAAIIVAALAVIGFVVIKSFQQQETSSPPKQRLVDYESCVRILTGKNVGPVKQIPATVIDKGILKRVPYLSFRAQNYEMNIYGDPSDPAGIEIGIYGELLNSGDAKNCCIGLAKKMIVDSADSKVLDALDLTKDMKVFKDLTFEVTPPSDEDAYGGWWVSVYSEKRLDNARATEAEMQSISYAPAEAEGQTTSDQWNSDDMKLARKNTTVSQVLSSTSTSYRSSGSVYVRGYTRKDGTYVHSYSRRR